MFAAWNNVQYKKIVDDTGDCLKIIEMWHNYSFINLYQLLKVNSLHLNRVVSDFRMIYPPTVFEMLIFWETTLNPVLLFWVFFTLHLSNTPTENIQFLLLAV